MTMYRYILQFYFISPRDNTVIEKVDREVKIPTHHSKS
jgi:hypothetical protein